MAQQMDVLVLSEDYGLCFLDGKIHEVKLNLDDPVARRVRTLLEAREGSVLIELVVDESGKGRVVTVR